MSSELGVERPTTLALPESRMERRVHFSDVAGAQILSDEPTEENTTPSPKKIRTDPEFRYKRKRSYSYSGPGEFRNKRRKNNIVLPSKFLLGGTISDPLNLGSLDKEGIAKLAEDEAAGGTVSKRSDAVRVIIPPNINDPLNLDASSDNEDVLTDALQKQLRRNRRRRKRKRRLSEPGSASVDGEGIDNDGGPAEEEDLQEGILPAPILPKAPLEEAMKPLTVNTEFTTPTPQSSTEARKECTGPVTPTGLKPSTSGVTRPPFKKQRTKSDNKIVSPVIPQPGVERKRHPSHSRQYTDKPHLSQQNLVPPKKYNPKNEHFQYGNYNKYYGYRNPDQTPDVRLDFLKRDWFEGKEVLDIGCNIGHITLTLARDFNPKRVVGIDIDKKLVNIAEKNIKHYLRKSDAEEANFPKSMKLLYGPLKPPLRADGSRSFPYNVKFVHANYVLESDELLETVRPEFDLILCLSVTKWIHLNWGDSGLKRFFRRIFYNLKPGGRLVLEPQGWPSYSKRRKLTKRIFENYKNIRLFPEKFNDYLLHEVGFSTSEKMVTPHHASRGFQRPIIVYTKAGISTKVSSLGEGMSREGSTKRERMNAGRDCEDKKKVSAEKIIDVEASAKKALKRTLDDSSTEAEGSSLDKKCRIKGENEEQRNVEVQTLSNDTKLSSHQMTGPNVCAENIENLKKSNNTLVHTSQEAGGLVSVTERQDDSVLKACDASVCDTVITGSTGNSSLVNEVDSQVTHSPSNAQSENKFDNLPYTTVTNVDNTKKCSATSGHVIQAVTPPGILVSQVDVSDISLAKKGESCTVYNVRTLPREDFTVIDNCISRKTEGIDTGLVDVKNNRHSLENKASVCNDIKSLDKEIPGAMVNSEMFAGLSSSKSPRNENLDCTVDTSPLKRKNIETGEKDNNICEERNNKQPRLENQ